MCRLRSFKQRFGDGLKNDVIEALIPKYFRREAEKQGLIPVSQPRVTDLHMHDGEPLTFKASFEVLPEIQVEGYKDLRADKPEIAVTDEEVEQALDQPARAACDLYYRGRTRRSPRATSRRPRWMASPKMARMSPRPKPIPCTWMTC